MKCEVCCFVSSAGKSIQLEQSPIASSVQRKHPYGLNIVGSHGDGDVVERADWWELLFYLNKLDPSQLDSILTMLASYNVKVYQWNVCV